MPALDLLKTDAAKTAIKAILGGTAGAAMGRYVTPKVLGYEDNPSAVNMSTLLDAALGAGLAGMKGSTYKALLKKPMTIPAFAGSVAGSELVPVGMNLLTKSTDAANAVASRPTAQEQIVSTLTSPTAKGVGAGAAAAGLGAILTGLLRPKRDSERRKGTSRIGMVKNDLMLYVVPAMIAGGILGYKKSN